MAQYSAGSPTGSDLDIGIAIVLHDRFSNQAREASSQIKKLHSDAQRAVNANYSALTTAAGWAGDISYNALAVMTDAVQVGAGFIDTMTTVKAITAASDEQMSVLGDTAQSLGLKTMFASRDIASGMQYLAMAGNSAEEINKMIEGAAMVANATGMELGGKGGAADMITNVMKTFRVESAEMATVVGDQLTKAALSSNMSMYDLAESIKYASADMVTLGKDIPEVVAMIGTLGNAGIQASMAGTALSNMARYFGKSVSDPNFKGFAQLEALGISREDITDANGELLDFGIILGKLRESISDINPIDQNRILQSIFGTRGQRAGVALMRDLEGYFELQDKIRNQSQGFTESIVEMRMNSLAGSIDKVMSAWENLKTSFTESLAPVITPILNAVAKGIEFVKDIFDIPVLGTALSTLLGLGGAVVYIVSKLVTFKATWRQAFGDSQVSARNMFALLKGGWRESTIEASRYAAIERQIINNRRYGIIGYNPKSGRYHSLSGPNKGKFVSQRNFEPLVTVGGVGRAAGKSAVGSTIMRGISTGFKRWGLRGALGAIGRGALGFLGGPVGWGITALSIAVPLLKSAFEDGTDSTEANTEALNVNSTSLEQLKNSNTFDRDSNSLALSREIHSLVQTLGTYYSKGGSTVTVKLTDGKTNSSYTVAEGENLDISLETGTK